MTAGVSARKLRLGTNLYSIQQAETRLEFDVVLLDGLAIGSSLARLKTRTIAPQISAASVTRMSGVSIRHELTPVITA